VSRLPRPFAVADLAKVIGVAVTDTRGLTQALGGIDRRWVRRCRDSGLTERGADAWATRCGLHPLEVWPSWPDEPVSRWSGEDGAEQPGRGAHATAHQVGSP